MFIGLVLFVFTITDASCHVNSILKLLSCVRCENFVLFCFFFNPMYFALFASFDFTGSKRLKRCKMMVINYALNILCVWIYSICMEYSGLESFNFCVLLSNLMVPMTMIPRSVGRLVCAMYFYGGLSNTLSQARIK